MIILVTGAAGFLGRNLVAHLTSAHPAATIIATDHYTDDDITPLDVRDPSACLTSLKQIQPTHIIHAAAITGPAGMDEMFSVNVQGTANLLQAAIQVGCVERFLLLSSSGLYDQTQANVSCSEEDPLDLSGTYALTKHKAETLLTHYEAPGFAVAAARIGPVYGYFERPSTSRPNISIIQQFHNHLRAQQPVTVIGKHYLRDWTHASDISRALEALLLSPKLNHLIYNVSSGISVSSLQILDFFVHRGLQLDAGVTPITFDPTSGRKPLCIARLQDDTNFSPHLDLTAGLTQLLDHP